MATDWKRSLHIVIENGVRVVRRARAKAGLSMYEMYERHAPREPVGDQEWASGADLERIKRYVKEGCTYEEAKVVFKSAGDLYVDDLAKLLDTSPERLKELKWEYNGWKEEVSASREAYEKPRDYLAQRLPLGTAKPGTLRHALEQLPGYWLERWWEGQKWSLEEPARGGGTKVRERLGCEWAARDELGIKGAGGKRRDFNRIPISKMYPQVQEIAGKWPGTVEHHDRKAPYKAANNETARKQYLLIGWLDPDLGIAWEEISGLYKEWEPAQQRKRKRTK